MRQFTVTLAAALAMLVAGSLMADAQTSRGAFSIPPAARNFTPIEKAACGPRFGRWCGPWHHLYGPAVRCKLDLTDLEIIGLAHLYSAR